MYQYWPVVATSWPDPLYTATSEPTRRPTYPDGHARGTGVPAGMYPASAVALEETTCVLIPRHAFFELLERYPSLVRGLLMGLTQRLVELTNRIAVGQAIAGSGEYALPTTAVKTRWMLTGQCE